MNRQPDHRATQHNLERDRATWTEKKLKAGVVAQRLRAIGEIPRYLRMKDCTDTIISDVCERCEARYVIQTNFCRDRLCPICSWRRALRLTHRLGEIIETCQADKKAGKNEGETRPRYAHLTLTVRNVPWGELAEQIKTIMKSWRRMEKRIKRAAAVLGWVRIFEVTRSHEHGNAHPHLHVLLQVPPEYFDQGSDLYLFHRKEALIRQWRECLHVNYSPSISINAVGDTDYEIERAIGEATKYLLKDSGIEGLSDSDFKNYAEAVHGVRSWSTSGRMRINDDEEIEAVLHDVPLYVKGTCRHCGGRMFEMREVWTAAGKMYSVKVARDDAQTGCSFTVNLNINNSGGGNVYVGDVYGGRAGGKE